MREACPQSDYNNSIGDLRVKIATMFYVQVSESDLSCEKLAGAKSLPSWLLLLLLLLVLAQTVLNHSNHQAHLIIVRPMMRND